MALARAYSRTPAQILIRWSLQRNYICIPKSVTPARIAENADVFDFEISERDMRALNAMNENLITGWDPTTQP